MNLKIKRISAFLLAFAIIFGSFSGIINVFADSAKNEAKDSKVLNNGEDNNKPNTEKLVAIKSIVSNNVGGNELDKEDIEEEYFGGYMTPSEFEEETSLEKILGTDMNNEPNNLGDYIEDTIDKDDFFYMFDGIKIIDEKNELYDITKEEYIGKIGDIDTIKYLGFFNDIKEIQVKYIGINKKEIRVSQALTGEIGNSADLNTEKMKKYVDYDIKDIFDDISIKEALDLDDFIKDNIDKNGYGYEFTGIKFILSDGEEIISKDDYKNKNISDLESPIFFKNIKSIEIIYKGKHRLEINKTLENPEDLEEDEEFKGYGYSANKKYENVTDLEGKTLEKILDLNSKDKTAVDSENHKFVFNGVKIVTKDEREIIVTKEDYGKSILELEALNGINFFDDIGKIEVIFRAELRDKTGQIKLNLSGKDELHNVSPILKTLTIDFEFTGPKEDIGLEAFNIEPKIIKKAQLPETEDNKNKLDKVEFVISVKDEYKEKLKINKADEATGDMKKIVPVSFTGYDILEGSLKKEEVQTRIVEKTLADSYEVILEPIGNQEVRNIHLRGYANSDELSGGTGLKYNEQGKLVYREHEVKDEDIEKIEFTNRLENYDTSKYNEKEFYYNDIIRISLNESFIETVTDSKFQYMSGTLKNISLQYTRRINIDFKRQEYKVSVDGGEPETFDVIKKDTKDIVFTSDKIEEVKIDGSNENLKGEKIKLEDLGDKVINIKTKNGKGLDVISFNVENRTFGSNLPIGTSRKFKGLEGTKMVVKPATTLEQKDGELIKIGNLRLLDEEEKEIVLEKGLNNVVFYFTEYGRVRYKIIHMTKYGDNWEGDLENHDYDFINTEYKDDDEQIHKYKAVILAQTPPLDTKGGSKTVELFENENFKLIDRKDDLTITGKEAIKKLGIKGAEEFEEVIFTSNPIITPKKDTLYIYSYGEKVKVDIGEDVEIPMEIQFWDGEVEDKSREKGKLRFPRLDEDYTIEIPIFYPTCYELVEENVKMEFLEKLKEEGQIGDYSLISEEGKNKISITIKKKPDGSEVDQDLYPKLPKKTLTLSGRSSEDNEATKLIIKLKRISDNCIPVEYKYFNEIKIKKGYKGEDGKIVELEDHQEAAFVPGTKVKLDLKKGVDNNNDDKLVKNGETFIFKPKDDNGNYQGLLNKDGKLIYLNDNDTISSTETKKVLGRDSEDIDTINLFESTEEDLTYYLMYEKYDIEEQEGIGEETEHYDYTNEYYYLKTPDKLILNLDSPDKVKEETKEKLKKYYEDFIKLHEDYYKWKERVGSLRSQINTFIENAGIEEISDLKAIKDELRKNNIKSIKSDINGIVASLDSKILELETAANIPEEGESEGAPEGSLIDNSGEEKTNIIAEVKKLNLTFVEYINEINEEKTSEEKFIVSLMPVNIIRTEYNREPSSEYDYNLINKNINYYHFTEKNSEPTKEITDDKEYIIYKYEYTQYGKLPLIISSKANYEELDLENFMLLKDKYGDESIEINWSDFDNKSIKIADGENINNKAQIVFIERAYKNSIVKENPNKPEPEEPEEPENPDDPDNPTEDPDRPIGATGRGVNIVAKLVDGENGEVGKELWRIEYRNLPRFFKNYSWKIPDYKDKGLNYVDTENLGLSEGDIKKSDLLEDGEIKEIVMEYEGEDPGDITTPKTAPYLVKFMEYDAEKPNDMKLLDSYEGEGEFGSTIKVTPWNYENRGYRLLDDELNETEDYSEREFTLSENKENNIFKIYYKKMETVNYDVKYVEKDGSDIDPKLNAKDKMVIVDKGEFTEIAKKIKSYTPLKDQAKFKIIVDENQEVSVKFDEPEYTEEKVGDAIILRDAKGTDLMKLEKDQALNKYYISFIYSYANEYGIEGNKKVYRLNEAGNLNNIASLKGEELSEPSKVSTGEMFVYEVNLENTGRSNIFAEILDQLPKGLSLASYNASEGKTRQAMELKKGTMDLTEKLKLDYKNGLSSEKIELAQGEKLSLRFVGIISEKTNGKIIENKATIKGYDKEEEPVTEVISKEVISTKLEVYNKEPIKQTYSIYYDGNGNTSGSAPTDGNIYTSGETATVKGEGNLSKSGYNFLGWSTNKNASRAEYTEGDTIVISGDTTLYAVWDRRSSGGDGSSKPDKPTEKPDNPDKPDKPSEVTPQKPSTPEEQDKVDRYKGGDRSEREDLIGMIIEEKIEYDLNKIDHLAYLKGYKDNTVRPEGNITREEAAMVFYRLMEPEFRKEVETRDHNFTDVEAGRWSEKAIATLANSGMITGYGDGSFKPSQEITRAEISSMIAKLTDTIILPTDFDDIVEHWAEDYINSIGRQGWIKGYKDGSFKPNELIKRSEFTTMVNSILERQVKKENILEGIKTFKDLEENKWYYEQMVEATNGHKYVIKDGIEIWTELDNRDFE